MMSSLLEQLENNEAILLMYLAGELPEADRLEVEQKLERDAALREQLAELTALQDAVAAALTRADAREAAPRRDAAVRRVTAAMERARDERLRDEAALAGPAIEGGRRRFGWVLYPAAAAAILLFGLLLMFDGRNKPKPQVAIDDQQEQIDVAPPTPPEILSVVEDDSSLAQVEREALSLSGNGSHFFDAAGGGEWEQ